MTDTPKQTDKLTVTKDRCTCAEVFGEDPNCALHGVETEWALLNTTNAEGRDQVIEARAIIADLEAEIARTTHSGEGERGAAINDIAAERRRQIEAEGWTPEHDDEHGAGQMATAAAAYAYAAQLPKRLRKNITGIYSIDNDSMARDLWPWERSWWKPTTPRRDLVKAGALIVSEIERIDRATDALPEAEGERE